MIYIRLEWNASNHKRIYEQIDISTLYTKPIKYFIETTTPLWLKGSLENKPACVFTSTSSIHGGNESTLLSMQIPLLHMGMILIGLPYSLPELRTTTTGGTPYGASHVSIDNNANSLSEDEKKLCFSQGERLAKLSLKLK